MHTRTGTIAKLLVILQIIILLLGAHFNWPLYLILIPSYFLVGPIIGFCILLCTACIMDYLLTFIDDLKHLLKGDSEWNV